MQEVLRSKRKEREKAKMIDLQIGDVIRLTSLTQQFIIDKDTKAILSANFKAPKGKVFVGILLGVENRDGSEPLNVTEVLKTFGFDKHA